MSSFSIGCSHPGHCRRSFIAVVVGNHPKTSVINCFLSHCRHGWLNYRLERHFWKSCTRSRAVIIVAIRSSHLPISTFSLNQPALNWPSLTTIAITLSSPNKSFPTYNISYYSFFTIHFCSKNKSKVLHSKPLSAITIWACLFTLATASPFFTERKGNYFQRFTKGLIGS